MSWNETLASSMEITAWCSGTLAPLCRALTLTLAVCCCALTSETIFPSNAENELLSVGAAAGSADGMPDGMAAASLLPGKRSICWSRPGEIAGMDDKGDISGLV